MKTLEHYMCMFKIFGQVKVSNVSKGGEGIAARPFAPEKSASAGLSDFGQKFLGRMNGATFFWVAWK